MSVSVCENQLVTLERAINSLESPEKTIVRQAVSDISGIIQNTNVDNLPCLYEKLEKPLINALQGRVESCREKSVSMLKHFISTLEIDPRYLVLLVPALHKRIGEENAAETSEEVRRAMIDLLDCIISKYGNRIAPFVEDLVSILVQGLLESAPEVKKASCFCSMKLCTAVPQDFYPLSSRFIKPLVECMTHQHWRVRVAAVETLGLIIQFGDNKLLLEVANPLAKRFFDDSHRVRLAVVKVVGSWMMTLNDRYSFFPQLLPHMLTSFSDQNDEVRQTGKKLWVAIGKQYLLENEKDYKDKLDLLDDSVSHYPPGETRSSFGCRCLVAREGYKLLTAISTELSDWLVEVRTKSAQLLSQLILHLEDSITQHVPKILPAMLKAATDEEPVVSQYVKLSAFYMGHFVPCDILTKLIVDNMTAFPSAGDLLVVSSLVAGTPPRALTPHLTSIEQLITNSTTKESEQMGMNELIKSIFKVCKDEAVDTIGGHIWATLIANIGLAASETVRYNSQDLMNEFLMLAGGLEKTAEIHNKHCSFLLQKLTKTKIWTVYCHEQHMLSALASQAGMVVGLRPDEVLQVISNSVNDPNTDSEVVLKMLMTSNMILQDQDETLPDEEALKLFTSRLVKEVLVGVLEWKPGRTAEALRSAAALCLVSCCSLCPGPVLAAVPSLVTTLLSLMEDGSANTRSLALRCITALPSHLPPDQQEFYNTVSAVLKRLDDCDAKVRGLSIDVITALYSVALSDSAKPSRSLLEFTFSSLLIHLDDPDPIIHASVLRCLMKISPLDSQLLAEKLKRENIKNKELFDLLSAYVEDNLASAIDNLEVNN